MADPICDNCELRVLNTLTFRDKNFCLGCIVIYLRKYDLADLGYLLKYVRENEKCAYCGENYEHVEHVIPRHSGLPTYTVPSCGECNLLAGGALVFSFSEKRKFIHKKLKRRYKSVLNTHAYTSEELLEFGDNLRSLLQSHVGARKLIEKRLQFKLDKLKISVEEEEFQPTNYIINSNSNNNYYYQEDYIVSKEDQEIEFANYCAEGLDSILLQVNPLGSVT